MIRGVTTGSVPGRRQGLGGLTPSGRAVVPAGWALYDFANTIFSYAVVSYAMGLWLVEDTQFGKANGPFAFSVAIAVSVGINAIVSPILGALSDRAGGRRLPYLLFFTLLSIVPTALIGPCPAFVGALVHARELRLPGRAHLLRRDAEHGQLPRDAGKTVGDRCRRSTTRDDLPRP